MVHSNRSTSNQPLFSGTEMGLLTAATIGGGMMTIHNENQIFKELEGTRYTAPVTPKAPKAHVPHLKIHI